MLIPNDEPASARLRRDAIAVRFRRARLRRPSAGRLCARGRARAAGDLLRSGRHGGPMRRTGIPR